GKAIGGDRTAGVGADHVERHAAIGGKKVAGEEIGSRDHLPHGGPVGVGPSPGPVSVPASAIARPGTAAGTGTGVDPRRWVGDRLPAREGGRRESAQNRTSSGRRL